MKRVIIALLLLLALTTEAGAFETTFMSVDFDRMELVHNGKTYSLVEVKSKTRRTWREVTYLCTRN